MYDHRFTIHGVECRLLHLDNPDLLVPSQQEMIQAGFVILETEEIELTDGSTLYTILAERLPQFMSGGAS